ncbi:hypothetical protein [Anaerobranca gottschalkii]|uniref:L-threonine kinase n=1 Tax=Anaerobranca gottschalkii DSM 13577 TaxID=1120990 RepID=A0A1I0A1Q5_9FIRM|nr:hypothetical protein [Anaerobranca gottschalkii]SES87978.1 L-threonine kinase [Anaerobranca gottschalkii DSM 13577]
MKVIAKVPGSCGELIQGLIGGKELLVSYPVNLYSTVEITLKEKNTTRKLDLTKHLKVYKVFRLFLKKLSLEYLIDKFEINISNQIPVGKGMASSTADLAGVLWGVSTLLNYPITDKELGKILALVDPTDSTIFKDLSLFDPKKGKVVKNLGPVPHFSILVLQGYGTIDTKKLYKNKNNKGRKDLKELIVKLNRALKEGNIQSLGEIATLSALENQKILYKPYLEEVINLVYKYNGYGLNIAHSGTVCGVIYDEKFDKEKFLQELSIKHHQTFEKIYPLQSIDGGVKIKIEREMKKNV